MLLLLDSTFAVWKHTSPATINQKYMACDQMDSQTKAKAQVFVFHFLSTRRPEGNKTDMKLMFPIGFQDFADTIIN